MDLVDEVIFDTDASLRCRQEALSFLMEHTEGFEGDDAAALASSELQDFNLPDSAASPGGQGSHDVHRGARQNKKKGDRKDTSSASAKSASGNRAGSISLARRQQHARQVDILGEFLLHQLDSRGLRELGVSEATAAHLLVEAAEHLSISGEHY